MSDHLYASILHTFFHAVHIHLAQSFWQPREASAAHNLVSQKAIFHLCLLKKGRRTYLEFSHLGKETFGRSWIIYDSRENGVRGRRACSSSWKSSRRWSCNGSQRIAFFSSSSSSSSSSSARCQLNEWLSRKRCLLVGRKEGRLHALPAVSEPFQERQGRLWSFREKRESFGRLIRGGEESCCRRRIFRTSSVCTQKRIENDFFEKNSIFCQFLLLLQKDWQLGLAAFCPVP